METAVPKTLFATTCCVLAFVAGAAARAEDVPANLRIDQVTVYARSAAIARQGEVRIPAGEHRLIVRGLPDPVDAGSLRVSIGSNAVRLGGVEIEKIVAADFVNDPEKALRDKLRTLGDQRTAILDDIATAQTQLKLIESLAAQPADRDGKAGVDGASLAATLNAMATGAAAARGRVRTANVALRDVDAQIAATQAELDKVRTAKRSTTEVRATIVASAAVTAPVSVEYRVNDAGWAWLYEARLDTQDKTLLLARQATISQGSGEDWTNAEVSVTTARPSADAGTPRVASLFVHLEQPVRVGALSKVEEVVVTANRARARGGAADVAQAAPIAAEEFATEFVTEYRVPGRVTISANRQARVYPISEDKFMPELVARAVMPAGPAARLEATFKYAGEAPIEAGRVQLYRDGAYVGDASLPLLLPGADVRMPFGIDDRIRVVVRDEQTESGTRGVVGRQAVNERKRRYEITSFHATALPIEIIDRVPVPQDSAITVQVLDGATPPTVKDLDGKAGVYLWRLAGAPRKTDTIRHYYSVRYPSDRTLANVEGGD